MALASAATAKLLSRTVMVHNGNIEKSLEKLNRVLAIEGYTREVSLKKYFERPCDERRRLSYERGKRIYDSEMRRRLNWLSRANRVECWPR